jgi:glycosyltransferase involved in cell wall biosynthesis
MNANDKKIAIVHDFLLVFGGAERVLQSLVEMYPEAPVYTLLADAQMVRKHFPGVEVRESFLAKFPGFLRRRYRWLLPMYPVAVEAFDLRDFDLVISSSGAWSKGIVTRLHTKHIAYIHSPMRSVWDENESYLLSLGFFPPFRFFGRIILSYVRLWDRQAAQRPDRLIANSEYTRERIAKYYRLPSEVVYPPVSLKKRAEWDERGVKGEMGAGKKGENAPFLMVSRLTEAKKIAVAIDAFNKLELPLVIIGHGPLRKSLEKRAGKQIHFKGFRTDDEMAKWYREARALIHVAEEDFGLAIAESLACGTPVIAFDRGGARELVRSGVNGELFFAQTPEILSDGVRRFFANEQNYNREGMQQAMRGFSKEIFQEKMRNAVNRVIGNQ